MRQNSIRSVLLLFFLFLATGSLIYIPIRVLSPSGSIDFHSYWYAGIFLRQGQNPFQAYLSGLDPSLPITFIDKPEPFFTSVAQPGLARVPANTAPIVWTLSIFSWLSWPAAKAIWLIFNLALIPVAFQLSITFTPKPAFDRWDYLILFSAFIALFGVRNTIGNGQTSLLVYVLMLFALLWIDKKPALAGFALGVALSKYSIALPVLIFFIIRKKTLPILTAFIVQIAAAQTLAWHTGSSLWSILLTNFQIAQEHTAYPGIHLTAAFPHPIGEFLLLVFSVMLCRIPLRWILLRKTQREKFTADILATGETQFILYHILVLFVLISVYHRNYDTFIVFPLLIWLYGKTKKSVSQTKYLREWQLPGFLVFCFSVLVIPASGMQSLFTKFSIVAFTGADLEAFLTSLCLSFLFLYCYTLIINCNNHQAAVTKL